MRSGHRAPRAQCARETAQLLPTGGDSTTKSLNTHGRLKAKVSSGPACTDSRVLQARLESHMGKGHHQPCRVTTEHYNGTKTPQAVSSNTAAGCAQGTKAFP